MMDLMSINALVQSGAILEVQDGNHGEKHPTAKDYVEKDGVPFLMARDFPGGDLDLTNVTLLRREVADGLRIGFARPGDVLLTHKGTVGATGIVPAGFEYVMLTPQVTYYRTDPKKLLNTYFRCAIRAPAFQHQLSSISAQSTRPYVSISTQKTLKVPVPELSVQRRIADIISPYDDLIGNVARRIRVLDDMARALYREWFVLFRYPGHEKARLVDSPTGQIPSDFKRTRLDSALTFENGKPISKEHRSSGGVLVFGANGAIGRTDLPPHATCGIVMGKIGSCGALHRADRPFWVTNNAFLVAPGLMRSEELVWHTLRSVDFAPYIGGAANPYLPVTSFGQHEVLVPPDQVQAAFQLQAAPLRQATVTLEKQVAVLQEARELLLPRLLSGKLKVDGAA